MHLQQVLVNLVMNGCDAMADGGERRPRLLVQTRVANANGVEVTVIDEGTALPPMTSSASSSLSSRRSRTAWD